MSMALLQPPDKSANVYALGKRDFRDAGNQLYK